MKARRAKRSTAARPSGTADLRARLRRAEESLHATSEILKVLSSSPSCVQPVFDAIIRIAVRLGDAQIGTLFRLEGNTIYVGAHWNLNTEAEAVFRRVFPQPLNDGSPYGRAMLQAVVVNVPDLERSAPSEASRQRGRVLGTRAVLAVPMLAKDGVLGAIVIGRRAPGAFSESYVSLLKTFAAQAVIAIENVRLFNETKETLGRQKATAEILKVIAGSPSDVQPVFDAIVRSAAQLFAPCKAVIVMREGDRLYWKARAGPQEAPADLDELYNTLYPLPLDPARSVSARAIIERSMIYIPDTEAADVSEAARLIGRAAKHRSITIVPLLREGDGIGAIGIQHPDPSFELTDRQVALLRTFADQAVIAIENVRLFNETKEALEQQTATAEILRVMSGSLTDIQPVVDVVAATAARLCEANDVLIQLRDGDLLRSAAHHGPIPVRPTRSISPKLLAGRVISEGRQIQVDDIQKEDAQYPESAKSARQLGFHTILHTPLMRAGEAIGTITMRRTEVKPFNEKQKALVRTFADQAVIAIENVRLFNETKEALEQQKALSEVLGVISRSPTDVKPVLDAIAVRAAHICDAGDSRIFLAEGSQLRHAAGFGDVPTSIATAFQLDRGSATGRAIIEQSPVHVPDMQAEPPEEYPIAIQYARSSGWRTILAVPLMRKGQALGAIGLRRREVHPFSDKQIALLKTFADQAAIAIDNARLFNETKEALEFQAATSEILASISRSMADSQPVFDAIVHSLQRLFDTRYAVVALIEDNEFQLKAVAGGTEFIERVRAAYPWPIDDQGMLATKAVQTGEVLQLCPILRNPLAPAKTQQLAQENDYNAIIVAPMLREGRAVGHIVTTRVEPVGFDEKEVALIKAFAAQAVIAIENARLFNETKEALEQQTATAEILQVISSSPTDVQPVFDAIVQSAARLFSPCKAVIVMREGDRLYWKARAEAQQLRADLDELAKLYPLPLDPGRSVSAQAILERRMIHIPDTEAPGVSEAARLIGRAAKHRSMTVVPLLREGEGIGTIAIQHPEPGFKLSDTQLALLRTFADQAVIAIENVRLFNETKEALERQTATSEVLKVISQTRIDLEPVLDIVLKNARRLCGADQAVIFRADGEGNCVPAALQVSERANEIMEFYREHPIRPNRGSATGRAMLERRAIHVPDVLADSEYRMEYATNRNYRSILAVPMLREGSPIGVLTVTRVGEPRPFTDKQIELVTSFADQAVIAIENVRLFNETTEALEQQKASAAILSVISSSIADAKPVFDAILESCERLFEGHYVGIGLVGEDSLVHLAAYHAPYHGRQRQDFEKAFPVPVSNESATGRAILSREVVHYPDIAAADVPIYLRRSAEKINTKSVIVAPMLWENRGVGGIFVGRHTAGPFSEKEIGLLKTFADQAVIAIQNARLFREIHEKSRQLEIANQHKSEFLANMSHELRTPLNAIIGFTRIVMRRAKEQLEPKQYENLEKIHSSGQHLLQLINAILDLSKVEAGRVEVTAADVALATVLEQCVKTVEPLVKAPAVRLLKEFDGELPQVYLDEEKLRQIVINLLSNAVKFTERGTVRVRAKCNGDGFSVAVADTGIGIPAEKLDHVFEEFAQADASSTRVYGGTGLGLTIARRLARLMGGDISAQSEPGVGSTFTLTLPVRYQALAEVRTEPPAQARA